MRTESRVIVFLLALLERNPITLHHSLRLRNSCGIRLG